MFKTLRAKTILAFLITGLAPFAIISYISLKGAEKSLIEEAHNKNRSLRDNKIQQIKGAMDIKRKQAVSLSRMSNIIDAMKEFKQAFRNFREENGISANELNSMREELFTYYANDFQNEYKKLNGGNNPPNLRNKFDEMDNDSIALQYHYIKANKHPLGEKEKLGRAQDKSQYSALHEKYHPGIRSFLRTFGYYDIFLVDPDSGDIVYSVFKELDFSTSLADGPYSTTNFGRVFQAANKSSNPDFVKVVDLAPYWPSYDYPAGFVASPIFDQGEKIGVLILQIPVEQIDAIMTNGGRWKETGMGESGETYLVGNDGLMRSNSRFLVEDPEGYFALVKKQNILPEETLKDIKAKQTTVLRQNIDTEGALEALRGLTGENIFPDYRGVRVISAYAPVNFFGDFSWAILSEMDEPEALKSIVALKEKIAVVMAIGCLIIIGFAFYLSTPLINSLLQSLKSFSEGSAQLDTTAAQLQESSENLAGSVTEQAANIEETSSAMEEMSSMAYENSDHASAASAIVQESRDTVFHGAENVENMISAVQNIQSSFNRIEKIVRTIQKIAFKTRVLSLNAALEAAEAGEYGQRFSVVAEEVRALSQLTENATKETTELIARIEENIQGGTEKADILFDSFQAIEEDSSKIAGLVAEIEAASKEQAQGCDQVSKALVQLDQTTQSSAAMAQETTESGNHLRELSARMLGTVSVLRHIVEGKKNA